MDQRTLADDRGTVLRNYLVRRRNMIPFLGRRNYRRHCQATMHSELPDPRKTIRILRCSQRPILISMCFVGSGSSIVTQSRLEHSSQIVTLYALKQRKHF